MENLTADPEGAEEILRARLAEFGVETAPAPEADPGADFFALIPGGGPGPIKVPVELRLRSQPLPAGEAALWHERRSGPAILAQAHVPRVRGAQYRDRGVNFIDSGGNANLVFPGFHVYVEGRKPQISTASGPGSTSASRTPAGLKVCFALLMRADAVDTSYELLAALARTSKGSVTNTFADLRRRGLVTETAGQRRLVDSDRLARDWVIDYSRNLAPRLRQLELVGPEPDWWVDHWNGQDGTLAGGAALAALGGNLRADRTVIYGEPPWHSIRRSGRLSREGVAPVILRQQFWSSQLLEGARFVPPLLSYADALVSRDPRELEVADELAARHEWAFRP